MLMMFLIFNFGQNNDISVLLNFLLSATNTIAALLHTTSRKGSSYYPIELHNILQHHAYKLKLASIRAE